MNKFYGDEWKRTAQEAGVFIDPGTSVRAGLEGAGRVLGAENNNDAATMALINRLLSGGGGGDTGEGSFWQELYNWWSGTSNDTTYDEDLSNVYPDNFGNDD
jgi:hypothetical protein